MSVSQLAELSNLSEAYISQVKHGKRPPSRKLLDALQVQTKPDKDYFNLFLQSRQIMGVSPRTLDFYKDRLSKFILRIDYLKTSRKDIEQYLNSIPANQYRLATRHASFRVIKTFYR
jgi:transcriptional regulator with XRE-family HTH domain